MKFNEIKILGLLVQNKIKEAVQVAQETNITPKRFGQLAKMAKPYQIKK